MAEVASIDVNGTCRACLKQDTREMFSIFDKIEHREGNENKQILAYDLLVDVSKIDEIHAAEANNKLPTLLCNTCMELLKSVLDFRHQCNKSQAILSNYLLQNVKGNLGIHLEEITQNMDCIKTGENLKDNSSFKLKTNTADLDLLLLNNNTTNTVQINQTEHKVTFDENSSKSSTYKKPFKCLLCKKVFLKKFNYEKHAARHKGHNLHLHIHNKHKKNLENKEKHHTTDEGHSAVETSHIGTNKKLRKPYKCSICGLRFMLKHNYESHQNKHTLENSTCHLCSKTFRHVGLLNAHLKTHTDERPYICKVCGRTFKQSSSVRLHMRTHTGERPYVCTECGKGFIQNSELKNHIRTHTKEKPYMCNICGLRLTMQGHLIQHIRTHTGEKPYKCSDCNRPFASSSALKLHTITHTDLKPFVCDVCKKSFNRKSTLRVHEKIHKNERPHVCKLCGKSFIQAHCLRSHMNTH